MFRRWFSEFIQKNKEKIIKVLKLVSIVAIFLIAIYGIISLTTNNTENISDEREIYKPTESIIYGSDIDQQEYEQDNNIVDTFINYCNEGNIEGAYNLLTDNCKNILYPTLEDFNEKYYKKYFTEKREYNLQAWVNNGNYTTYRLRIIDDILSTGNYEDSEKYEDYITIVNNNDEKKININSFIETSQINKKTEKDGIIITVISVDTFMDHQEYTLEITNNTSNNIILDNMENPSKTIRIDTSDGFDYGVRENSVNSIKLGVTSGQTKTIKINFDKKYTSGGQASNINFTKVITNYDEFLKNKQEYEDIIEIKVEV